MSVTIDPRRHDAVLFDLDAARATATMVEKLRSAGVRAAAVPGPADAVAAVGRLGTRPGRAVVVTDSAARVVAARDSGFALTIGVGRHGADAVVDDLGEIAVRTGDRPMSALPDAATLLDRLGGGAARPAVFFDFDGTLSDIVADPDSARLTAGAAEALQALAARCPVAVLSGRDLGDVRQRVGLSGIWYAGSHGFELSGPDGTHHQNDAAATAEPVLTAAAVSLAARLEAIAGVAVEHKRFAVAVHYRNAARGRVGEVAAAVRAAGRQHGLRVTTGREVIELRPDIDWDKGKTLCWVLQRLTGADGPLLPLYLGDDITDEDAFDAMRETGGIGIVVRHSDDGDRPTAAQFALDSPARVAEFSERLAHRLAG